MCVVVLVQSCGSAAGPLVVSMEVSGGSETVLSQREDRRRQVSVSMLC